MRTACSPSSAAPPIPATTSSSSPISRPCVRHEYRIGVPEGGLYMELINSDSGAYGGGNVGNMGRIQAEPVPWQGRPYSLNLTLPPLSVLILRPVRNG